MEVNSSTNFSKEPTILFDGVCNLCNTSVQFIIRRDPKSKFKFASLQSEAGKTLLEAFSLPHDQLHSVIFINGNKYFERSRAALEITKRLSGLWPLLYVFIIVPPFISDYIYNWVAGNRYKWFGVRSECMIPTPDMKKRFL